MILTNLKNLLVYTLANQNILSYYLYALLDTQESFIKCLNKEQKCIATIMSEDRIILLTNRGDGVDEVPNEDHTEDDEEDVSGSAFLIVSI